MCLPQRLVPGFRTSMEGFYDAAMAMSRRILRLLALSLDLPPAWFLDRFKRPLTTLRLLHYSAQPSNLDEVRVVEVLIWDNFQLSDHVAACDPAAFQSSSADECCCAGLQLVTVADAIPASYCSVPPLPPTGSSAFFVDWMRADCSLRRVSIVPCASRASLGAERTATTVSSRSWRLRMAHRACRSSARRRTVSGQFPGPNILNSSPWPSTLQGNSSRMMASQHITRHLASSNATTLLHHRQSGAYPATRTRRNLRSV